MSESVNRIPVSYIQKSRAYYLARGFDRPYRWAHHDDSPFTPLPQPLAQSRVGVVTTSVPLRDPSEELLAVPKGVAFAQPCDPPPVGMFTNHLSWHKEATNTDDLETFLPLETLSRAVESGRVASTAPRFYGVPTNYSQRETQEDALTITQWCREDAVDVVLLIPL